MNGRNEMDEEIAYRKASIRPVGLLSDAKDLVGEQYWLFVAICLVGTIIGSLAPMAILMGPMMCGIYLCFSRRDDNETVEFEVLFKGFDFFVESLIASLLMFAAMMVILIPTYLIVWASMFAFIVANQNNPPPPMILTVIPAIYLLIFVLMILVSLMFVFVYPLIADRGLKAIPAIKASFRGVIANFGGVLGMVLLHALISVVASCFCFVPALFLMPLSFGATFLAYRQIYPRNDEFVNGFE